MSNCSTDDHSRHAEPVPRLALTMAEAGQSLGISPRTVEELVRTRLLRVVRVGRRVVVPVESLRAFLTEQMEHEDAK
jgi:excisionase family DNA binding protein